MPPHVPRKRLREDSPVKSSPKRHQAAKGQSNPVAASTRRKPTLYDDLDATITPDSSRVGRSALDVVSDSDEDSSLSDLSDGDFEDVPSQTDGKPRNHLTMTMTKTTTSSLKMFLLQEQPWLRQLRHPKTSSLLLTPDLEPP
ncbi:rad4 transglutaminase-like domain-containing protein [Colletotrichum higginsianum]|nr:rad4 transglutaminase-like domain-containing protein [Colletotrichum higginsianum]